jgi:hypothetical protein
VRPGRREQRGTAERRHQPQALAYRLQGAVALGEQFLRQDLLDKAAQRRAGHQQGHSIKDSHGVDEPDLVPIADQEQRHQSHPGAHEGGDQEWLAAEPVDDPTEQRRGQCRRDHSENRGTSKAVGTREGLDPDCQYQQEGGVAHH